MTKKAVLRAISFTLLAMAAPVSIAASAAGCATLSNHQTNKLRMPDHNPSEDKGRC